ncbi:MAG: hypothetical protein IJ458_02505 [Clostridia bacterium]|nr:hypothetical protein [Clostridia bacterium]
MNISVSNVLATSAWMAFLSVLAIIGIIVAGGFIVALLGRMVLSIISPKQQDETRKVDEFGYSNEVQGNYITQSEEIKQHNLNTQPQVQTSASEDYAYAVDVDKDLAKEEEEALNNELNKIEEDDFFDDFVGEDDVRFGDDDLMGMIDEISQDVLDEEEQTAIQTERAESEANKSLLEKYSIDSYFDEEDEDLELEEDVESDIETVIEEDTEISTVVDEQTLNEINSLKQQVKEIVESMQENKNQNETFNEQLINILNELKEANKKEVRTAEDAEREINDLKQQLEQSRIEMEEQLQARIADKDAEMQEALQQQLEASNAEIESLKAQLSELINKMEDPEDDAMEVEPVEEQDELSALREEVKEMIDSMREENEVKTNEFNSQILEILNELKQANLEKTEEIKVETNEDAIEQVEDWQEELEVAEKELNEQFKEEMIHKDDEEKEELRSQMESYNQEINDLKEQLAFLMEQFKNESENAKNENQVLLDQLEAERQQRIKLEQEKLEIEKEQQEQLELLRKENEELIDKIQTQEINSNTLTQEEMDDLYSETNTIDYSAISKMNEEQIEQKIKVELEDSKQEIDDLKEQVNRLTNYIKEREDSLADKINVHEVRTADFDIEQIKQITSQEVEDKVKEKIIESFAEIEILKEELVQTKQQIEEQYKDQLANTDAGMEYERISQLQESAEKIDSLNEKLEQVSQSLQTEQDNIQNTTEECVAELESAREAKIEVATQNDIDADQVSIVGPKSNTIALVSNETEQSIEKIDIETVKELTEAELDEIVEARLESSNKEIENLKKEIENLKKDLAEKDEQIEKVQETSVPVVRSPLFDVEMIKTITAQEVEKKVQERLAEAMKEIEEMKAQLELSKQEIERQYKEEIANNRSGESEVKDKLKGSAAEVIELKEQLIDLTEQIALEHQEAKQNSEVIAEQLGQDREIAKQQLAITETSSTISESTEVTVIGPKNNQVALVSGVAMITEEVGEMNEDIPTIDIETVKQLTEQEIEEKVQQRMASSIIEIEDLKKQILNLSLQIQEIKGEGEPSDEDDKPMVFHYATEEAYLERLAILDERLKSAKKDLKINNKELNPLEKVKRTLERDKLKLRRKYAIVAKKKVALYGVNNYVDIDKDKAEKLAQELELLEGLKLSVGHCEEVMNANVDRYPILVHTDKILRENIANIESDIENLNKELKALREKNGSENV